MPKLFHGAMILKTDDYQNKVKNVRMPDQLTPPRKFKNPHMVSKEFFIYSSLL